MPKGGHKTQTSRTKETNVFVKDILRDKGHDVYTIQNNVTLMEVVDELVDRDCGSLVVVDDQARMVGIITERDVLSALSERHTPLSETALATAIQDNPTVAAPTDKVNDVMRIMTKQRIRHMPVVDTDELIGIVSIGDVVKAHEAQLKAESKFLKEYIIS